MRRPFALCWPRNGEWALEQQEGPGGSHEPRKEEARLPASMPAPGSLSPARPEGASRLGPGLPWSDAASWVHHPNTGAGAPQQGGRGWTGPQQQRPVVWDVCCGSLGQSGQALRSFGAQQPHRGASLRDISFQKHWAAAHVQGHTGPPKGKEASWPG